MATHTRRLAPSLAIGLAAWAAYTLLVSAVQASSGVPYAEWFRSAHNAWRVGALSLAAGSALLVGLVMLLRWDHLWRDPSRLPVTRLMQLAMAVWVLQIVVRVVGVRWGNVPPDLLAAIVASGVLVGFAEELLFRGMLLRGLRAGGRVEWKVALWVALCFGLFHLPNVLMGMGLPGLVQVPLAATSGVVLYLFRRRYGVIWPAMVAHGTWDISTFLSGGYATPWLGVWTLATLVVVPLLGLAVAVQLYRRDRTLVALPQG